MTTEDEVAVAFAGRLTVSVFPLSVKLVEPPLLEVMEVEVAAVGVELAVQPMVVNELSVEVAALSAASRETTT